MGRPQTRNRPMRSRPLPALPPCGASPPRLIARGVRRTAAATLGLVAGGCASVAAMDPVGDDGSPAFAAACVGVLAAEKAAADRAGGVFTVDGHRALNEWMFQASRRSSPFDNEMGRAAERRRWAESLPAGERARRAETCIKEAGV